MNVSGWMKDLKRITKASPEWGACIAVFVTTDGNFMSLSSRDDEGRLDFVRHAINAHTDNDGIEDEQ